MYFKYENYFINGYNKYEKIQKPNSLINILNRIIFKIKKYFLHIILDKYSRVMLSNMLSERLPLLYSQEKELKYRTPSMQFTDEELNEAKVYNKKDILYTKTLLELYLI